MQKIASKIEIKTYQFNNYYILCKNIFIYIFLQLSIFFQLIFKPTQSNNFITKIIVSRSVLLLLQSHLLFLLFNKKLKMEKHILTCNEKYSLIWTNLVQSQVSNLLLALCSESFSACITFLVSNDQNSGAKLHKLKVLTYISGQR